MSIVYGVPDTGTQPEGTVERILTHTGPVWVRWERRFCWVVPVGISSPTTPWPETGRHRAPETPLSWWRRVWAVLTRPEDAP